MRSMHLGRQRFVSIIIVNYQCILLKDGILASLAEMDVDFLVDSLGSWDTPFSSLSTAARKLRIISKQSRVIFMFFEVQIKNLSLA